MSEPIHPDDVAERIQQLEQEMAARQKVVDDQALAAGKAEANYRKAKARAFLQARDEGKAERTSEQIATRSCEDLLLEKESAGKIWEAHRVGNGLLENRLSALQSLLRYLTRVTT